MSHRSLSAALCLLLFAAVAWVGSPGRGGNQADRDWLEVAPGVLRSMRLPAGHALVAGTVALLIDVPHDPDSLKQHGIEKIEAVLLTHHHWDTCLYADRLLARKIPVRAAQKSAEWLTPDGVRKHWQESIPLRHSRAAYQVVPVGFDAIDCSLADRQTIDWQGWKIQVIATPGHSRDHLSFAARRGKDGPLVLFAGDAVAAPGKMASPYTTDWNHWTDEGLVPAADSLRKLAALTPALVLPAHASPIVKDGEQALKRTADAVAEVGFLKSFERYTKERLGNAPQYAFLAKEQAASGGKLPWSPVSKSLFLTGNTYVLTSKDNAFLVMDPWGQLSADQIEKLRRERNLGRLEVVMFSHAHFDHYDGIYYLPERDKFQVWTLDRVAEPIAEPFRLRAPFLDARPVRIDRRFKHGATAAWREYRFRFVHFPGQSEFTMGVETTIDGKKCFFTADNFFHQDQFSGSGGWMGLNRSFPLPYAASAQQVLDAAPDWVLAEHGGPFEFNAEDFRRRVRWGQACAAAADALSPTGNHRRDWDPHRLRVEPLVFKAKPGSTLKATVAVDNPLVGPVKVAVTLRGRGLLADQSLDVDVPARGSVRREVDVTLSATIAAGRHVFLVQGLDKGAPDGSDGFFIVDVE